VAELTSLTVRELGARFCRRDIGPVDVARAYLTRIEALDGDVRAYLTVTRDQALAQAAASEARFRDGTARGPLDGVPVALKDLFCTRGVRTTAGSKILAGFIPPYESTVTAKLRDAGVGIWGSSLSARFRPAAASCHKP